ncbi:nuclear transport factor 2 family protein [Actinophytocola gossypii]|uniref:Nuclear transport factor 2 family protein n=1 Tax=Actinophytocola gossypii TaxID=2812003 RepID=A0ABT2J1V6_9PSEU|nr:nuclear transport factor 2 family protein [Actinophytocola gossypii]MCT2581584.1 nuclear transport factor 2 family protein [Actinophytocola gossypii]
MNTATAIAVVEDFLAAMGAGRIDDATRHLAPEPELVFPGGRRYHGLVELTEASAGRYRFVDKHRDSYETLSTPDGDVVVYSIGRLFGENAHGVRFDGVRYVDRFRLRDDRIVEQWVWNDLAETGVLTARTPADLAREWRP